MQLLTLALGLFAALTTAQSQNENPFIFPTAGAVFTAGQSSTLKWTPTTNGTVSLRLQWGATTTSTDGVSIASAIDNTGSYAWNVPADIPVQSDYFIRISDDADAGLVDYSARFSISGATGSSTTASSSSASSTSSSSSASSTSSASSNSTSSTASSTSTSSSASSSSSSTLTKSTSSPASASASSSAVIPSSTSTSTVASATTSRSSSSTASASATSVPNSGVGDLKAPAMMMVGAVGVAAALGVFAM